MTTSKKSRLANTCITLLFWYSFGRLMVREFTSTTQVKPWEQWNKMIDPLTINPTTKKPWDYPVYPANFLCPFCLHALSEHGYRCSHWEGIPICRLCHCNRSAKGLSRKASRWAKKMNKRLARQYQHPDDVRTDTVESLKQIEKALRTSAGGSQ